MSNPNFTPNNKFPLKYLQKGDLIKQLQVALKIDDPTGNFYNTTEEAIIRVTGEIGLTYKRNSGVNKDMFDKIVNKSKRDDQIKKANEQLRQQVQQRTSAFTTSTIPPTLPPTLPSTLQAGLQATSLIPTASEIPPPLKIDISGLLTPDVLNALKDIRNPKAFGDQVKEIALRKTVSGLVNSKISILYQTKKDLIEERIALDVTHKLTLEKLKQQNKPVKILKDGQIVDGQPVLSDEEYAQLVEKENKNYDEAKKNNQKRKDENNKAIQDYWKDPFAKIKEKLEYRKNRRKLLKARSKSLKQAARKNKRKILLQNAVKEIIPVLIAGIINQLELLIAQNAEMKKLVDSTNEFITRANTSNDRNLLITAKIYRDNALRILNNNVKKITDISEQIRKIQTIVNIFNTIVNIIVNIPVPTSVPPGIGLPVSFIMKTVRILDKASRIVTIGSAYVAEALVSLDNAVAILEDYKSQLLEVNSNLENAVTGSIGNVPTGSTSIVNFENLTFPPYKNFTFKIKQENNPSLTIAGNKRHYAIAINRSGVEVLRSQLSFTLEPDDLIEELKIIIDRRNLQG